MWFRASLRGSIATSGSFPGEGGGREDIAAWKKTTLTEKRMMVAAVLMEQLKLKVHLDMAEHPVYNLVVAKGGPKLTEYRPGDTLKAPGPDGRSAYRQGA